MRQGRASEPEKVRMSQRKSVRAKDEAMRARESLRERQRQSHPELAREPEKMSMIASKNRSERYSSYTDV